MSLGKLRWIIYKILIYYNFFWIWFKLLFLLSSMLYKMKLKNIQLSLYVDSMSKMSTTVYNASDIVVINPSNSIIFQLLFSKFISLWRNNNYFFLQTYQHIHVSNITRLKCDEILVEWVISPSWFVYWSCISCIARFIYTVSGHLIVNI